MIRWSVVTLTLAAGIAVPRATWAQRTPVAILNAKIHVEPGSVIEGGTILLRDGKIAAVGKNVAVPAGAERIDAAGKVVTAGLIDASSRIGLVEVDEVEPTNEGRFAAARGADAVHAAYRVSDGYNPDSVAIPVARSGGVTTAISTPRGGLIAGMAAAFSLRAGSVTDVLVADRLAMYATLGERAIASAEGSRGIAVERLRELFDDARDYARRRSSHERNQTRDYAARRLDLAALGEVLRGKTPLVVRVNRGSDISAALRLAKEIGIRIVIEGGVEAWKVRDELAAARVGVILDPFDNLPMSFDQIHVVDDAAARLVAAGVDVAISVIGDAATVRTLRQRAGVAIANGLSWDAALAAVTTTPARLFGLADRGRIARGAAADVVVWSGDPFELSSRAELVFCQGEKQSLDTRQSKLLRRYRRVPKRSSQDAGEKAVF
jgi:imidazolonepropionase-like amidohydrolase